MGRSVVCHSHSRRIFAILRWWNIIAALHPFHPILQRFIEGFRIEMSGFGMILVWIGLIGIAIAFPWFWFVILVLIGLKIV